MLRDFRFKEIQSLFLKSIHATIHQRVVSRRVSSLAIIDRRIARLTGGGGETTWLGRGLFAEEGSPWVYLNEGALSYRTHTTACYTGLGLAHTQCYDAREADPLFATELPEVSEDEAVTEMFRRVFPATMRAIALNRIAPPPAADD